MSIETDRWTELMLAADGGDERAYRTLLETLAPHIRAWTREGCRRSGAGNDAVEDIVQETLLALHLKRHTWDRSQPLAPWVRVIAKHKLIDALRRTGRRVSVPIEDFAEVLPAAPTGPSEDAKGAHRLLAQLSERHRAIVTQISLEGRSAREVASALGMTEVAVRVNLHRALKQMATLYRKEGEP
ncbi:MAG TPA: sigma-70 family RNA polymerase sigma factor [Hyphomicrobiaceae bacterium]|nr:sigma-70 family RNA polymerase sigma factor [Hyphomicrobiaceae bacterium]